MNESQQEEILPKRNIGISGGIIYGIGCGIGGMIFTLLGPAINLAGPGVLISLILGGILIFLIALNFSELATSLPVPGGGYSFTKEAVGGFQAFIIGFFLWIANVAACAFSAQAFALSVTIFLPFLSDYTTIIAIVSVLFIGIVVFRGSVRATNSVIQLTVLVLLLLILFIISGLIIAPFTNTANFNNEYITSGTTFLGTIQVFSFLFVGFTTITSNLAFLAPELKHPSKSIPKIFMAAIFITLGLYLLIVSVVLLNIGNEVEILGQSHVLLADIMFKILGPVGFFFMGAAGIIATLIAMNASLSSAVGILHALARDNYVSKRLLKKDKKTGIPIYALFFVMILSMILIIFTNIGFAAEMTSFIYFFALAFVNFAALNLRNKRQKLDRPFKAPFFPFLPIITGVMCLIFAFTLSANAILLSLIIFIIGITYYMITLADRNSIVLTVSGIKFLSTALLGIAIWVTANLAALSSPIEGNSVIFREVILRILIYICIFSLGTVVLDIWPLREIVYIYAKKVLGRSKDVGIGPIIELDEKRLRAIHYINIIIAFIQIISAVFVFFIVILISNNIVTLENVIFSNTIIEKEPAEFLFNSILILFGCTICISGLLLYYSSRELKSLRI